MALSTPLCIAQRAALSSVLVLGLGACGNQGEATATERLWVSSVPTNPKQPITAFLATRTSDGKYLGAFFKGSLYRGGHDVFEWKSRSGSTAELRFMQDGSTASLKFESCKPSRGFDHCLLVSGDPTGTRRYQSRKRWTVRRGKKTVPSQLVTSTLAELAEDDQDLRTYLEL